MPESARELAVRIGAASDDEFADWQLDLVAPILATALAAAKAQAKRDAFEEAAREIQHQARSMRMAGIPCDTNEIKASTALSLAAAIRALAAAPAETEKPR